jgi:small-conductance mechanosensitive channel
VFWILVKIIFWLLIVVLIKVQVYVCLMPTIFFITITYETYFLLEICGCIIHFFHKLIRWQFLTRVFVFETLDKHS